MVNDNDHTPIIWRKNSTHHEKETVKKHNCEQSIRFRKLDDATDVKKPPNLHITFRTTLQKARLSKQWTQKDLANRLNVKPTVVQSYENGTVQCPDRSLVAKMSRILGVRLPTVPKK